MEILRFSLFLSLLYFIVLLVKVTEGKSSSNGTQDGVRESEYDYDPPAYYDYYDENEGENIVHLNFHKCFCAGNEIWNKTHCLPMTYEQIRNATSTLTVGSGVASLNMSAITNIMNCSGIEMILNMGSFYFLNDENIYHLESDMIFEADSFCLEFIGDQSSLTDIIARTCLLPPEVPICCQIPHKCVKSFTSQVTLGQSNFPMSTKNLRYFQNFQCSIGEIKHKVPLDINSSEVSLAIFSGQTQILWNSPPPLNVPFAISNEKYCIEIKESAKVVHFCYKDPIMDEINICKTSTCTRKCCPEGFVYSESEKKCVASNETMWKPSFMDPSTMVPSVPENLYILYGYPWCSNNGLYQLDGSSDVSENFYLLKNGNLFDPLSNKKSKYSEFCLEKFLEDNKQIRLKALICFKSSSVESFNEKCKEVHGILYPTLIVVSCAFLFITLVVYASVPELYANLHGKSLLSHVTSLLIAYVCQVIISWSASSLSMVGCKLIALGTQISFLWAFFWLNVMCFDIWWTLKSMSPSPESGENSRRRFMLYSVYAWGCPLLIGFATGIMEFLPHLDASSAVILPGFGIRGCWFQDVKSTWLYFHGFTLLLYVLNIFFFFHVAAILIISQRLTEGILRITRKQYKERVFLYLKLFVVMGITWICEVASWQEGTCEYWMFTDIINSLQGMFLFLIFMCNKKVFQKIHTKASPAVRHVKSMFKSENRPISAVQNISSSSQRTTQTSLESSSRRMSSSSLNAPGVEISLKAVGEEHTCNPDGNKFY